MKRSWYVYLVSFYLLKHILIICVDFDIIHQNFYKSSNLRDHS